MNDESKLYFEAHVTIEPVFDERLETFNTICNKYSFRAADLLMKKRSNDTEKRSSKDSFCTSRSKYFNEIKNNTILLVNELKYNQFKVWRYKIEDTIIDSRSEDEFNLLNN